MNTDKSSDESFCLSRDGWVIFRVNVTERTETHVSGNVESVVSWDGESREPNDVERHLDFYMKWDGCCHLSMGEVATTDKDGNSFGYYHFCGAIDFENHIFLLRELWKYAAKAIPMMGDEPRELELFDE